MASHFKIGDLVWAKMKGFPAWPGRVIEPKAEVKRPANKKPQQFVFFFGSENYAWIMEDSMWLYAQNKSKFMPANRVPKGFKEAIEAIDDALKAEPEQENYRTLDLPSIEEELAQIFPGRTSPHRDSGKAKKRKMVDSNKSSPASEKGKVGRPSTERRKQGRPPFSAKKAAKIGGSVRGGSSEGRRSSVGVELEEEDYSKEPEYDPRKHQTSRPRRVSRRSFEEDPSEEQPQKPTAIHDNGDNEDIQIIEDETEEVAERQEQRLPRRPRRDSERIERQIETVQRIRRDTAPASFDLLEEHIPSQVTQVHVLEDVEEAMEVNGEDELPHGVGVTIEGEPGQTTTIITLTDGNSIPQDRVITTSQPQVIERVRQYDIQDSNFYVNVVETLDSDDLEGGNVGLETIDEHGNVIYIHGADSEVGDDENLLGDKTEQTLAQLEEAELSLIPHKSPELPQSPRRKPAKESPSAKPTSPKKRPAGVGQPRVFQKKTKDMMHVKKRPPSPTGASPPPPATKKSRLITKVSNTTPSVKHSPHPVRPSLNHNKVTPVEVDEESETDDGKSSYLDKSSIIPTPLKIGFLGLGIMGQGMANNLLRYGHEVTVWNRTGSKCRDFVKEGALRGNSPADVVSHCDITFSCVSDPTALREIVFGNQGILQGIRSGKGYIDMSTVDAETVSDINEAVTMRGGRFLEAPVSGSKGPAHTGELVILAAGDRTLFEDCSSCFQAMGKKAFFLGETGNGVKMKLVVNLLMGTMIAGLSEAMALTEKIGLDQDELLQILNMSAMSCPLIRIKGQAIMASKFEANFPLQHQQKDIKLAINMADTVDQPLHVGAAANELFKKAKAKGYGEHDVAAVYRAADM